MLADCSLFWETHNSLEAMCLPDRKIEGRFVEKWAGIGNSVPLLFMKAIAECIRRKMVPAQRLDDFGGNRFLARFKPGTLSAYRR